MRAVRWVSLEGLNGVGKTYLCGRLAARLGSRCLSLRELTDQRGKGLAGEVMEALTRSPDAFLRTGYPLTETFALLALKVREYESLQHLAAAATPEDDASASPRIVIEDRGVDTVAVYQAAILGGTASPALAYELARRVQLAATPWRPQPDLTVLLVDDPALCVARFEQRLGRPLSSDERGILDTVEGLYAQLAADQSQRVRIVDRRGRREEDVLDELEALCRTSATPKGADLCRT